MAEKVIDTPIGKLRLLSSEGSLIYCNWDRPECDGKLKKFLPLSSSKPMDLKILDLAAKELEEYFAGCRISFTVPIKFYGTSFQVKVWEEISKVPLGNTASYKALALKCGCGKGVRAVAQACGANPLAVVVGCHRIVASDGSLGGYTGGVEKKVFLLELEKN